MAGLRVSMSDTVQKMSSVESTVVENIVVLLLHMTSTLNDHVMSAFCLSRA